MKYSKNKFAAAFFVLLIFLLWTAALCLIDVQPIGPNGSTVGFATVNKLIHRIFGVQMWLYAVTDWLSLIPIGVMFCFALMGLFQWIGRKQLRNVDASILILGGFYAIVFSAYMLFEAVALNCRPILISGYLEPSYPSSTTVLVLCVMLTAQIQVRHRFEGRRIKWVLESVFIAFDGFMVIGRLISGVHWFTDIVGGVLLSAGLVMLYSAVCDRMDNRKS